MNKQSKEEITSIDQITDQREEIFALDKKITDKREEIFAIEAVITDHNQAIEVCVDDRMMLNGQMFALTEKRNKLQAQLTQSEHEFASYVLSPVTQGADIDDLRLMVSVLLETIAHMEMENGH